MPTADACLKHNLHLSFLVFLDPEYDTYSDYFQLILVSF